MSMMNGHFSETDGDSLRPSPMPPRSESELSDLNDAPQPPDLEEDTEEQLRSDDDAIHDMATSEMEDDEDAPGELDDDYDMEPAAAEASDGMRHDRSSSEDRPRPGKRKAEMDDERHILQNPELYGLRRSVRVLVPRPVSHPR